MRIVVVGAGPAGLYFALLTKLHHPSYRVTVFERNPRANTFGWGVVFSDQTLGYLAEPDPVSYRAIRDRLVTWNDVAIVHRGEQVRIGGNRFSGIARIELLAILQRRCAELGVELRFESEIERLEELPAADLLVGADGVGSRVRELHRDAFRPRLEEGANPYVWYGTRRLFDALTLTFRPDDNGLFIAHSYAFSRELSTFIVECDEATYAAAGLGERSEPEARAYLERVFAADLAGEPLLSNQSRWIRFVNVRCGSWHHGSTVLLGDAAHTAHFSIGSGTKLALEDAIALAASLEETSDPVAALALYEERRRPRVEEYQEAARASLGWFESARADLGLDPLSFAYKAMTRSDRVSHESLRRRDPAFAAAAERHGLGRE